MSQKRFEYISKTSWKRVNKSSLTWWYVLKTSWRRREDVLKTFWRRLQDVLKTSWRRFENVLRTSWRCLEDVLKTSWQDVLKTYDEDVFKMYWRRLLKTMSKGNICVLMKTSWRRLLKRNTKDVFKTSSRRLHQGECLLGTDKNQQRWFPWSLAKFLIEQVCVTAFNRTALFYRTALRDCFCNFKVVKVRFLIYCTLLTKLHYFSYILPKSINLVSLERYYQVEHHFILFL